ncbi:CapA family protein [Paenibacillus sp. CF384]|uniref:CapA family protein n=1 Tax=Paenibacillus sp. CF384 TaxID=1884382 RepID=UPI000895CDB6|nr:CapA family protein [Paenibacillus sp. CF384]SDX65806.1 poly-gamma-glutamate synthesis protein (capsule biosynthesis protein) [Paenibacillus sp. CF384]
MEILIASDLVPTGSNEDLFAQGDIRALLGEELFKIWNASDMRVFNLEVPLTDQETPIAKTGPNLIAKTRTIHGIKQLQPTLVTLANNHILDQGTQGFHSTKRLLEQYNIPFVGAADNVVEAAKPHILHQDGISVGIYACAENEFTIATATSAGANPFDPLESLDHIQELKQKCDYVIVLYHGGKEHYRYPSPNVQRVCRKMVQKGADLVICQHSHCVGAYENYLDSKIIYGHGNFIFDYMDSEYWQSSLLIKIHIGERLEVNYVPVVKQKHVIRAAQGSEVDNILNGFYSRSEEISQEGFVERRYQEFAHTNTEAYLKAFSGLGKWMSRIDRKLLNGRLLKQRYSKPNLLAMQNFIECEAHRELLLAGLKTK